MFKKEKSVTTPIEPASLTSLDCWDYSIELECLHGSQDLQLAAELGKTLLERNKELETCLKQHQNIIEDQTQEIEYLTKQTAALREVNDSRLRIYEQLEVSIQDLERANQRLALDNSADKKHIKSLCLTIDSLEARCEELQRSVDEMTVHQNSQRRRRQSQTSNSAATPVEGTHLASELRIPEDQDQDDSPDKDSPEDEEVIRLMGQVQELRSLRTKEQRKAAELEEQLATVIEENMSLEEQLTMLQQKEADMKSLQEEISTLEEVRQGHLCGRCLRNIDSRAHDELSLMLDHEEEEDVSVVNSLISESQRSGIVLHMQEEVEQETPHVDNPYRVLVEKYEALLEMQRHPASARPHHTAPSTNCLSLQEELQMSGDFGAFNGKAHADIDQEEPEIHELPNKTNDRTKAGQQKVCSATPTDFSEAETSSSGFSDETSNKATQTDSNLPPGSFLCSIADGDDCRFSIYDDASPIESRFRKTPEYRQLFREIFAVLKRAAEAKDEGEQLPLLEDLTPVTEAPRVPPATPAKEDIPADFSNTEKQKKSKPQEVRTSELPKEFHTAARSKSSRKATSPKEETQNKSTGNQPDVIPKAEEKMEQASTTGEASVSKQKAPKQDILEYLSMGVGLRKKSSSRKNSPVKVSKMSVAERVERLEVQPNAESPGVSYAAKAVNSNQRRRREFRNSDRYRMSDSQDRLGRESPTTLGDWMKRDVASPVAGGHKPDTNITSPSTYQRMEQQGAWNLQPFVSSASQEVAKLKRLEKSYAEVLRLGPQKPMTRSKNGYRK